MTRPSHAPARSAASDHLHELRAAIAHAEHLVPAQSPLDRFVHHNPLHAFEHLPFEEAVVEAAAVFGTEPWLAEAAYRHHYASGRIRGVDLDAVLGARIAPGPVAGMVERRDLVRALLIHPIDRLGGEPLAWRLTETPALKVPRTDLDVGARAALVAEAGGDGERALRRLWAVCQASRDHLPAPTEVPGRAGHRVRDRVFERTRQDLDRVVHPLLIRWCGAYLDHGVSYWPMAGREKGFPAAFFAHHAQSVDMGKPWLSEARVLSRRIAAEGWDAERICLHALERMGHPPHTWRAVVQDTALALPGWAGMFQRLKDRPDTAPEPLGLPAGLGDFLAVRLVLDLSAAEWALARHAGSSLLERAESLPKPASAPIQDDPAWYLFQLAQILGIGPHSLDDLDADRLHTLVLEARSVHERARRALWHAAYERRFRVETLDAVAAHSRRAETVRYPWRRVQVAFCIDDREESMRRLLEETAPWVETIGVAGNYGISMYYKGVEHGHAVALGPAGFEPRHLVVEHGEQEATRGRWTGLVQHHVNVGSHTLFRGAMVTLGGVLTTVPLTLRLLAPKLHARWTARSLPERTTLALERPDDAPDTGLLRGFTLDEMVRIVRGTLEFMALTRDFAPLVFCLGHGSRSMNNPHEAAHDCGACGGGRGGPNGRAFATMANDPRVRQRLRDDGIEIPEETWFIGGYHNTADDAIELYDLHLVPERHHSLLGETRRAFDEARALDALERCRKYENVPLTATPAQALEHVENRDEDLAQPRPEYGHCSNAICFVGRRAWSRGLFLDRRAFLCSYDPALDPDGAILSRLLAMAVPVGAGINLEYWFSYVDPTGYGSGTKLPHNITGLIGVMNGHQSDLRTGLPWQMIEFHEPVRLLCVVEAPPERLLAIASEHPDVGRLVTGGWVQVASLDPRTGELQIFEDGGFRPWRPESHDIPRVPTSRDWFGGTRGLLPPATVTAGGGEA